MIVVVLADRRTARCAADALDAHRRAVQAQARNAGLAPPSEYDALAQAFRQAARSGQERPSLPIEAEVCSPSEAMAQLLLTYEDAGRVLGLSARQIRRLVAEGEIFAVTVADRTRRIHADDVTEYAARLRDMAHRSCEEAPAGLSMPAGLRVSPPPGARTGGAEAAAALAHPHHHERSA